MILADARIKQALEVGSLGIKPFDEQWLSAASYDFHLSPFLRVFDGHNATCIDPLVDQRDLWKLHSVPRDSHFTLHPGQFALASSIERFTFDEHHAGRLEGKSSVARFGLIIHAAGFFDPGFVGYATLELFNPTSLPIKLYPGMVIGQMSFFAVSGKVEHPYKGKYQDQPMAPEPSRYYENYSDEEGKGRMPHHDFAEVWFKPDRITIPDFQVSRTDMEEGFVDVQAQVEHDIEKALHPIVPPHIGAFRDSPTVTAFDLARTTGALFRTRDGRVVTQEELEAALHEVERKPVVLPNEIPPLFKHEPFVGHSGRKMKVKIECDALTARDWYGLAKIASVMVGSFREVIGVPTGGLPFAQALRFHATGDPLDPILIADDVFTTGGSMREMANHIRLGPEEGPIKGVVAFARDPEALRSQPWIRAVWASDVPIP